MITLKIYRDFTHRWEGVEEPLFTQENFVRLFPNDYVRMLDGELAIVKDVTHDLATNVTTIAALLDIPMELQITPN